MVEIAKHTKHVSGLPVTSGADAGGDPGPFTALGVYLGIKAAIREGLKTDSAKDVRIAIQGVGSVGGGVRSEEHTSELQSLMRTSYAVFCLKKKKYNSHSLIRRLSVIYRSNTQRILSIYPATITHHTLHLYRLPT